jgi:hypothetical protein
MTTTTPQTDTWLSTHKAEHSLRLAEQTLKNMNYGDLSETERQLFHAIVELLTAVKDIQGDSVPVSSM